MTPSKFPQLKLQHYRQTDLLQSQRNLDRLFNPSYGIAVEPAMIANEPGDLNRRICSAFATLSIFKPPAPLRKWAWLGYSLFTLAASVSGTTTTTGLLALMESRLITTTGRVPACSLPSAGSRRALKTSPRTGFGRAGIRCSLVGT